jgi:type III restriction enzyme
MRHWELDEAGQPTQKIIESRRNAKFITPIPKPKKRKAAAQTGFVFDEGKGLSTKEQQYDPTSIINEVRGNVDAWRSLPNPNQWQVTPETARLLQHWRHHKFSGVRPFFCQVEAVETAIWLTEAAPLSKNGKRLLDHLAAANRDANPELMRLALKLATGAGKTTVMAMLIAWQTINAVRRPASKYINRVVDLSATPFFLRGSGYAEGTLFPWTMSDFSLMDAIECGIVKLPRVPVADNIPGTEMPMFRNLWEHVRTKMPKKGRGKQNVLDPLSLPTQLQTALEALYGHYEKTFNLWEKAGIEVPPCFILVCNNTSTSKLIYDYISGFLQENDDGSKTPIAGRFTLFQNFDEHGNPFPKPNTLLIDSEQLESGEALDDNFRSMASDEIERFRREIVERGGKLADEIKEGKELDDVTLLREVMNTVGKQGQLGGSIRCVVSVSMLTEGWDANTVTHVLGVRAFGTQLLCEQVIGRALRRQSYDLNENGLLNVEYADILGIPFDFTAKPVVAPPQPPRETVQVKAMRPERDSLEVRFPRVEGYRIELPEERLSAEFNEDSVLELTPDLVGATETRNSGIIGEGADLNLIHTGDVRPSQVLYELTSHLVLQKWREPGEDANLHLFGQLKRIAKQWLDGYLICKGGTYPAQLKYKMLADMACNRIIVAINRKFIGERPIKALLDPYNPTGSTRHVRFNRSRTNRWDTSGPPPKNQINWVVLDSDWEAEFCRVAESHPKVIAYTKNHNLGLEVPYRYGSETRRYLPDFIVLLKTDMALVTCCISSSRSKATGVKMRKRRNLQWTLIGCQA